MAIEINPNSQELIRGHSEFKKYETESQELIVGHGEFKTNNFLALATTRRSIRKFENKDLSKGQLMQLIDAAQSAPSAGNCQPWHFYIVKNKKLQAELKESAYNLFMGV